MADSLALGSVAPLVSGRAARPLPSTLVRSIVYKFAIYGMNALTGIVTARALNPAGRGELAAMTIWPVVLAGVTTVGLPSALIYHIRRNPSRASEMIGCGFLLSVGTGVIGTALGWYLVPLWLHGQPATIIEAARYCILATTVYSLTLAARAAWEAEGRLDRSHLLQSISPITVVIALVPLAALGMLTPRSAAAIYVFAGVPTAVWCVISVVRAHRPSLQHARSAFRELLVYGSRSYGVDLCNLLSVYLDQALVVGLLMPEAMGLYVVALSLSRIINAVQGSVALTTFPKMVGLARRDLAVAIARAARLSALVSGAIGLLVMGLGGILLSRLYGASFAPAGGLLRILVCEVVLAGIAQVLLQGFLAAGRPGVATLIQLSGLALSVPVFLTLVPIYGALGAAIALLTSTSMRLLLTVAAYPAFLQVPMPRVWIGPADLADLATYRGAFIRSFARARTGAAK